MQLKLIAILLIVAFSLQACTSTYDLTPTPKENHPWLKRQYRTYQDLIAEAKSDPVELVTIDGQQHDAWLRRADADSIGWLNAKDSTVHILPTSQVQALEITHYSHSWLLGGLIGLAGSLGFTYATGMWEPVGGMTLDYSGPHSVPLFVIGGTIIGGLVGNASHHTNQYLIGTAGSTGTTQSR